MKKDLIRADGNWVEGKRFWNRETEVELLIERIEEGSHTRIVAQRRLGKTSLMREVARLLKDRYICLHLDFQDCQCAEDIIANIGAATRQYRNLWNN